MSRIAALPTRRISVLLFLLAVAIVAACATQDKKPEEKKEKEGKPEAAAAKTESTPASSKPGSPAASAAKPAEKSDTATAAKPVEKEAAAEKPAAASAATSATGQVAVTRGPLKIESTLSGNLEANKMTEVSIAPKQWSQLVVTEAVPAGTRVTKGQALLKLDTTKIDEAIRELEAGRALAELSLRQAVEGHKLAEKSLPVEVEAADRTRKIAEQDYEHFVKVDEPQAKKSAEFQLKSSEQNLEYVTEELKQLEKMYKADDLTEETEEIILKRARNDVERAQHSAEQARIRHNRTVNLDLPRTAEQQKHAWQQAIVAWEKARLALSAQQMRQKLELDKLQQDHKKSEEKLAELKRDRELLTITAPADGIVFYGRSQNGKWATAASVAQKLRPGGQVMPYEILFTIVSEGPWTVRATASERDAVSVRPGTAGQLKLTAHPKLRLPVKVREVGSVPNPEGSYDVALDITAPSDQPLVAGMSGAVKLTTYFNADTITVPSKAVFEDEMDVQKQFVYVVSGEGKPEKRSVVTGHTKDDVTEIVSGLAAGDKIFLEKPAQ